MLRGQRHEVREVIFRRRIEERPRAGMRRDHGATFIQRQLEQPRVAQRLARDRRRMLRPRVDHHAHPALRALAVERPEPRIAGIHRLGGRMDLQHPRPLGQAVIEFRLPVFPLRVDGRARDEQVRVTADDAEQVLVGDIERGVDPIRLARLGVATVLGQQHDAERAQDLAGLAGLPNQGLDVEFVQVAGGRHTEQSGEQAVGRVRLLRGERARSIACEPAASLRHRTDASGRQ